VLPIVSLLSVTLALALANVTLALALASVAFESAALPENNFTYII
jgi:hypothetical protein